MGMELMEEISVGVEIWLVCPAGGLLVSSGWGDMCKVPLEVANVMVRVMMAVGWVGLLGYTPM